MNSKFDDLQGLREDIEALKTAVGDLRDWIADKFGVQVFDSKLLLRGRQNSQDADEFQNFAAISNRTLIPMGAKTPYQSHPQIEAHDAVITKPKVPFNTQATTMTHPIHIIHHPTSADENIQKIQPKPAEDPQETNEDSGVQEYSVTLIEPSNYANTASTSASYVIENFLGKGGPVSPASVEAISSSNSMSPSPSPADKSLKSRRRPKKRRKTKPKASSTPSAIKTPKLPEDSSQIQCEICGKLLSGGAAMKRHMQTHKNARTHVCTDCGKSFQRSFHLKTHRMIHSGEKKHQCRFCGRLFLLPKDLICHERTHTGEKPFGCSLCSRRFNLKSHLTMHFRTHTGEKPYKCDMCDKCFSQSNSLRVHKKTHQKVQDSGENENKQFAFQLATEPQSNADIQNQMESEIPRVERGPSDPQEILILRDQQQPLHHAVPIITIMNPGDGQFSTFDTESNALFVFQQQ